MTKKPSAICFTPLVYCMQPFFFEDLWLQKPYAREHRAWSGGRCMLAEKGRVDVNTCWGCVHGWDYSGMPAVEAKLHCRSWEDFPHTFSFSFLFFFLDPANSKASATTPDSLTFPQLTAISNRWHGNCFTSHKLVLCFEIPNIYICRPVKLNSAL